MVELLLALLTTMTGIERTQDADLTAIAQRRAVEIQANFSHSGWVYGRDGEAEIIAQNFSADPVTTLALQWQASPPHWAILTDRSFTRWGCAISQAGTAYYGVCIFGTGGAPAITAVPKATVPAPPVGTEPAPTTEPTVLLPNTAQETSMNTDLVRTVFTYLIALVIIVGGGLLLIIPTQLQPSELLPFLTGVIGVVVGYVFGERSAASATANQPTVTTSAGPPATTTMSPTNDGHDHDGGVG